MDGGSKVGGVSRRVFLGGTAATGTAVWAAPSVIRWAKASASGSQAPGSTTTTSSTTTTTIPDDGRFHGRITSVFAQIDGVPGDSTNDDHAGEIDVLSWTFEVEPDGSDAQPFAASPAAGGVHELRITAPIGSHSPALLLACATGSHIDHASVTGYDDDDHHDVIVYELRGVTVRTYELDESGATDTFTLHFLSAEEHLL